MASTIQEQGGGRLSINATAAALELSATSSSFGTRISAARHFALIEESDEILSTTSLAKRILRPTSPDQEKEALSEAFRSFHVFKQLLERFHGIPLPNRPILENILVIEYGISDVSKSLVYDVFISSGKFAGQITDTGKGLVTGLQEERTVESSLQTTIQVASAMDERLTELLMNVGSLRTSLEISTLLTGEALLRVEDLSRSLLERTLGLARDLGMAGTRLSLKVLRDRLSDSGLKDASRFASYLDEGLNEDLTTRGFKKLE